MTKSRSSSHQPGLSVPIGLPGLFEEHAPQNQQSVEIRHLPPHARTCDPSRGNLFPRPLDRARANEVAALARGPIVHPGGIVVKGLANRVQVGRSVEEGPEVGHPLLDLIFQEEGCVLFPPRGQEPRARAVEQFGRLPQRVFDMTKIEDLNRLGGDLLAPMPEPPRPIRQHDHFGRLRAPRWLIDALKDRPERFTLSTPGLA